MWFLTEKQADEMVTLINKNESEKKWYNLILIAHFENADRWHSLTLLVTKMWIFKILIKVHYEITGRGSNQALKYTLWIFWQGKQSKP